MVDGERLRMVGWGVAAVVTVFLAARLLDGGGGHEAAAVSVAPGPAHASPGAGGGGASSGGGTVLVQVAGEVAQPGVYRIRAGSRVTDAVQHAGGLTRRA